MRRGRPRRGPSPSRARGKTPEGEALVTDAQVVGTANALVPGITVTGALLMFVFWLLSGRVRREGEVKELEQRLNKQIADLEKRITDEATRSESRIKDLQSEHTLEVVALEKRFAEQLSEIRQQRDKYERLAWDLKDVAQNAVRQTEQKVGLGNGS